MKLSEKEQFLTKLLRSFPGGSINVFDRKLRYVLAEGKGLEKVGLSPEGLVGKTLYEVFPPASLAIVVPFYQRAFEGEECEFELIWSGQTYRIYVTPIEEEEGRINLILALALDITESKRRELNLALLAGIQQDFAQFLSIDEVMRVAGARVSEYLHLSHLLFVEINDTVEVAEVFYDHRAPGLDKVTGCYRLSEFHSEEELRQFRAGNAVVINDVRDAPRSASAAEGFEALSIRALATAPYISNGRWKFALSAQHREPHQWREDEVELLKELAARVYLRIESARAEVAVRESKARFDIVKDAAQVGFWFCDLPFDNLIWDQRVKEHFWLPPDAAVTIDTFYEQLHPEDRERTRQAIDESIANHTQYEIEYRTLSPEGREKWIRAIGRTFYDAQENPIRFDGVTLDITQRKRAEEALRESEARFRNMADHAPVMIWVTEADMTCTYLSQSWYEFTGQTPETGLGLGWLDATHPDDCASAEATFAAANEHREAFRIEYRLRRKDGVYRWAIDSATPRFSPAGEFLGYIGSVIDITERRQTEEALRENDRRKDEFLAMLAHELRNPLAPIRNAAQVLKLLGPADANQQRAREIIERQTQHLTRLVDDLLDVSRITRGKIVLQREPLELAAIVNRAVEASRPLIDKQHHQLTLALPTEPLLVEGDLTRLVQVVSNLLNNAAKYTDEGGKIWVEAMREGDEAVVRVRDNGIGLPGDLLPHIFDLFSQADQSLDRSQGGLGIGLTLVRRLVELHGGQVAARSAGSHRGSEFIVRLPLIKNSLAAVASLRRPSETSNTKRNSRLRVLVVEDNADAAEMMAFMLRLDDHEVRLVYNGLEAFEVASAFQPQVVLCDLGLPGMNGYEVAKGLRQLPEFQKTRLIALSGYGHEQARRQTKEAGFDYHLLKPVEPDALKALLDALGLDGQFHR